MQPAGGAFRSPPTTRTAFGVPLAHDERVVYAYPVPPPTTGDRAVVVIVGLIFLPIVVGLFIILYAFMMKNDRAWFITNKRIINVTSKGVVKQMPVGEVVFASVSSGKIDLRGGGNPVTVPLVADLGRGVGMLAAVKQQAYFASLPGVDAPP